MTVLMSDWRVDESAMVAATICGMSVLASTVPVAFVRPICHAQRELFTTYWSEPLKAKARIWP